MSDDLDLVRVNDCRAVRIALASPEEVLRWSSGEVTKADTINYRTHRPEKGGLFCERIFGPERDWECACGKQRGMRLQGTTCPACGVLVTQARVRRKRMGHIELAAPVVHVWFFKGRPSILAQLLGQKARDVEEVVYQQRQVVLDPGTSGRQRGEILNDALAHEIQAKDHSFRSGTGAEAIEELLRGLDLVELAQALRRQLETVLEKGRASVELRRKLVARLEVVEALLRSPNRPEWLVLHRLPVIPPDLRPVLLLDRGTYATSDLNDLYRRVLQRNLRLKKLLELRAPEVIQRNEKRLLQQAVDALFDNSRLSPPIQGAARRPLRSLTDMIKGKQGRFRENLLGKRVDYSARSVIVVGPELKLHQCGLPKKIALELYQPFIIRRLLQRDRTLSVQRARRLIKARRQPVWDVLEEAMRGHPVLLNRAPTLHRMGIQAFDPVLVEGNAIRLHPLVCKAFNADFDGDQMAVHIPLSIQAVAEAKERMMPTSNIFSPANGQPIITPSKDMVLGCYFLTVEVADCKESTNPVQRPVFAHRDEVHLAHSLGKVGLHTRIRLRLAENQEVVLPNDGRSALLGHRLLDTTVGRVLFNEVLPAAMPFYNLPCNHKNLARIIADCQKRLGNAATVALLESLKTIGFRAATRSGLSFATADLCTPEDKDAILAKAQRQADVWYRLHEEGLLSEEERRERVTSLWEETTHQVSQRLMAALAGDRQEGQSINPLHAMVASGARGSAAQIGQLAGMRGAMRRPSGAVLETPIKASFREGLSSLEYFSSTHGARKGLVDLAMRTSDSGYLTRKLVDVAQHVVVTMEDCGTSEGIHKSGSIIRTLAERVHGRVSSATLQTPRTHRVFLRRGEVITAKHAQMLEAAGFSTLAVRSPLTCRAPRGVCRLCYGVDRSTGRLVALGTAVGVIAAQSIGEPATQLTMRTFHTGGAAVVSDITLSLPRVVELFEAHRSRHAAVLAEEHGQARLSKASKRGRHVVTIGKTVHVLPAGRRPLIEDGTAVAAGTPLTAGPIAPQDLLRTAGRAAVQDYLVDEVQKVYRLHGVDIDDKHVEVIVAQMLCRVRVNDPGHTELLPGQVVEQRVLAEANARLQPGQKAARATDLVLGISKAAVQSASFLSAAAFQETTRVLTRAALAGQVDELAGLKENVLLGQLVPAGTGFRHPVPAPGQA